MVAPPMKNFRSVFDPGWIRVKPFIPNHLTSSTTSYPLTMNEVSWGKKTQNMENNHIIVYFRGARVRSQKNQIQLLCEKKCADPLGSIVKYVSFLANLFRSMYHINLASEKKKKKKKKHSVKAVNHQNTAE